MSMQAGVPHMCHINSVHTVTYASPTARRFIFLAPLLWLGCPVFTPGPWLKAPRAYFAPNQPIIPPQNNTLQKCDVKL
jgi:hypothetical protein